MKNEMTDMEGMSCHLSLLEMYYECAIKDRCYEGILMKRNIIVHWYRLYANIKQVCTDEDVNKETASISHEDADKMRYLIDFNMRYNGLAEKYLSLYDEYLKGPDESEYQNRELEMPDSKTCYEELVARLKNCPPNLTTYEGHLESISRIYALRNKLLTNQRDLLQYFYGKGKMVLMQYFQRA